MPQTPALSYYLGPLAVYTSDTGMTDPITGIPYLGGTLHQGDYVDATLAEIAQWNVQFGAKLNTGRYRFVRVSSQATAANIKYGAPVGWARPSTVGQLQLAAAGSGATTDGTYTITSTTSGGTAAVGLATVSGGVITAVQLTFPGANFTSVPTFGLTEITGLSAGSVLAQMAISPNVISSLDASAMNVTDVRGIALCSVTTAQVTANCWIVIQELGIAPLLVTTAAATASGSQANAVTAGVVTTTAAGTQTNVGYIGQILDLAAAATIVRVDLALPVRQG
jgi:hypothetical protein